MATREITLHDRDGKGHSLRLVRNTEGMLYCEVTAKHAGTPVYSTLRLGELWEIMPQLMSAFAT